MTTKFVQLGDVIDHTPGANVANGKMVVIGVRVGIALAAIAANTTGPLAVAGMFTYAKLSTDVVAQGALLYYDSANDRLTTTASGNTLAGYAAAAAGNGATTVAVKLNA